MSAKVIEIQNKSTTVPLVFEQSPYLPLVSMELVFRDGGALSDSVAGVAKLSSRLLNEGTKQLGSVEFASLLESRAVSINASVGRETFVISVSSLAEEFEFAIEMLISLLKDPNYSDEAFDKVKSQTIGQLTQKQSDFDYVAANGLNKFLFEGTPREYPASGTLESVENITLDKLKEHIETHLGLENLIVVMGGDIEQDRAVSIAKNIASILPSVSVSALPFISVRTNPIEHILNAKTEQAYVYFGSPYNLSYDSDEVHLSKVASFVLGSSGFGSRLMEEIRVKRGLAYSAYGRFNLSRTSSYFSGHLQTKLESGDDAKKVVQEVVDRFVSEGITADELESAKKFLLGSEPLRNETLNQRLSTAFSEYYAGKELGYREKELELIENISLDTINKFIKSHTEIRNISFFIVKD